MESLESREDQGGPVLVLLRYNVPTYCNNMLHPSMLEGWEDWTLAKEPGGRNNNSGTASRVQGGGRSLNAVEERHIMAKGNTPALLRLRCHAKRRKAVLACIASAGSPMLNLKNKVHKVR